MQKEKVVEFFNNLADKPIVEAAVINFDGCWLAEGFYQGEARLFALFTKSAPAVMFKAETEIKVQGQRVAILALNANNAAIVRRFVKKTTPEVLSGAAITVGFSDDFGLAASIAGPLFRNKKVRPVLTEVRPVVLNKTEHNMLTAMDAVTWGLLAGEPVGAFGAGAVELSADEDVVKALLYGYSKIGLLCEDKINRAIDVLSEQERTERYGQLPSAFRAALAEEYLGKDFCSGQVIFSQMVLEKVILKYGAVILFAQNIYNTYLKNAPWQLDFALSFGSGELLTPVEYYVLAQELKNNGMNGVSISIDALAAKQSDILLYAEIAAETGQRLAMENIENVPEVLGEALSRKSLLHLPLHNILWLSSLECLHICAPGVLAEVVSAAGLEVPGAEELSLSAKGGRAYADLRLKILREAPQSALQIKESLEQHGELYQNIISRRLTQLLERTGLF